MFIPGETVIHEFIIPFVANSLKEVRLTYRQNDRTVLDKPITSGFAEYGEGKTKISITFSQEESLLFDDMDSAYVQINVLNKEGTRATSKEMKVETGKQNYREVMTSG